MIGWMLFSYFLGLFWGYVIGKIEGERNILNEWEKSIEVLEEKANDGSR